jgi:hypothetical protein
LPYSPLRLSAKRHIRRILICSTSLTLPHPSSITAKSRISAMTDVTNDRSFPQFGQLPKEVRLIIWEMALPRPRVVNVRMRSLKKTYLQWKRETEGGNETMENASYGETTLPKPPELALSPEMTMGILGRIRRS